jgi:hypothetical protein
MLAYHSFYLLRHWLSKSVDPSITFARFEGPLHGRPLFKYWLGPIMRLPRPLGIFWGGMANLIGRVLNGDLRRGIAFAWNRLASGGRGV